MAGLLSMGTGETPTSEGVKPDVDPTRLADDDEGPPNVSPEEQASYEEFVNNALLVIHGGGENGEKGVKPDILNRLRASDDPLDNLANTAAWLTTMIETSAEKNGAQLDDAVVFHGGRAIFEELAEVAEAAAIYDYSEKELEGAWYRALDLYRETATEQGRFDPDQAKADFQEIEQADRQGRMGDVLPALAKGAAPAEEE